MRSSPWLRECRDKRAEWEAFKAERFAHPTLFDEVWHEGATITDGGASYMGFATSAVLATALGQEPWRAVALTGDSSFTMNPAVLIDGIEHGATGVIVVFDNRRIGAVSSLQRVRMLRGHADQRLGGSRLRGLGGVGAGRSRAIRRAHP